MNPVPVSIAIPTYRREGVLLDTLDFLLALEPRAAEIMVLDQSEQHEAVTDTRLAELHGEGRIRWLRLDTPSIPQAMNRGLREAREDIVLFLDDDIKPGRDLVATHYAAHQRHEEVLVAGRVIQPWEEDRNHSETDPFCFAGTRPEWIAEFMGGNFSVSKTSALALGGMDENFVRVAFRFEAEFAHRFLASGRRIRFEPGACLHHLKSDAGGTRSYGTHLTTWKPDHAVGAYYCALRTNSGARRVREFAVRLARSIATRHHLRRPWFIPVTLSAELQGMAWALALSRRGPRLTRQDGSGA